MHCESAACTDLTQPFTHATLQWLLRDHSVALVLIAAYVSIKLVLRMLGHLVLCAKCNSKDDVSARVWDSSALMHNLFSVAVGLYTVVAWDTAAPADTCSGLSSPQAFIILLQVTHWLGLGPRAGVGVGVGRGGGRLRLVFQAFVTHPAAPPYIPLHLRSLTASPTSSSSCRRCSARG